MPRIYQQQIFPLPSGQLASLICHLDQPMNGTAKAVIACHGHGGNPSQYHIGSGIPLSPHAEILASNGFVILALDHGGVANWAGNAAMTALDEGYTWLQGKAYGTKVGLLGWSMGGVTAINWLKRNPAKVSACQLYAPALDLSFFHANAGYKPELETVYGVPPAYNDAGHNVATDYASYVGLGVKTRIIHSTDDPTVPYSQSTAFMAAVNDPAYTLKTVTGVGHLPMNVDLDTDTLNFFSTKALWEAA